ncbi:5-hydroxytryptamine receptor 3A-like [Salarias fasciatus]|uniref:5-hydroxytryptamine receptor 3A-like n=1 Tax=Salarias fasciatus TaxID=181472 RepID=UPI001176610D|nr:5-hydroxytryptamine receptor 3A-like [Salarias fasciatus]
MEKVVFLLSLLAAGRVASQSTCTSRRCLAEMLIKKGLLSQPQDEYCFHEINVTYMFYETLSVDTKKLHLNSRLEVTFEWKDPELMWDQTVYPYGEVVLPVNKVWTPRFQVTNAIETDIKHTSNDLLVRSDGTLQHEVSVRTKVNCEVNLFNYPFASDECPIAIDSWYGYECGTLLNLGGLVYVTGTHGDWQTDRVELNKYYGSGYILVALSIKPSSPFITLQLPSILILLADVGSFALPLTGGERNSFKVTLALSFTVFLNILSDQLPGDSQCGPIIRIHFCVCLVLLVVSMLVSMLLTRVANEGCLFFCCCFKMPTSKAKKDKTVSEETTPDIAVVQLTESEESQTLRNVSKFLDGLDAAETEKERHLEIANRLDRIFFWIYFICTTGYFIGMMTVMAQYKCSVNHFRSWQVANQTK